MVDCPQTPGPGASLRPLGQDVLWLLVAVGVPDELVENENGRRCFRVRTSGGFRR
jgi:hypothetical protein